MLDATVFGPVEKVAVGLEFNGAAVANPAAAAGDTGHYGVGAVSAQGPRQRRGVGYGRRHQRQARGEGRWRRRLSRRARRAGQLAGEGAGTAAPGSARANRADQPVAGAQQLPGDLRADVARGAGEQYGGQGLLSEQGAGDEFAHNLR